MAVKSSCVVCDGTGLIRVACFDGTRWHSESCPACNIYGRILLAESATDTLPHAAPPLATTTVIRGTDDDDGFVA